MKVLIADDHKLFRDGLRTLLEGQEGIEVVATCEDGKAAVREAKALRPDVVLMDITMPGLNGIEATRALAREAESCRVVILSMHSDRRYVLEALRAGARGFFLKNSSGEDLVEGLNGILAGEFRLCPKVSNDVIKEYIGMSGSGEESAFTLLSVREREILQHLAEGHSTKEIAAALHVSVKTVETHRSRIMAKLEIHTIPELTKYAIREGLTPLE